ncbi:hypothetical protein K8I85_06020 [bacterium]|nr:hypothetical protein [bacterium]
MATETERPPAAGSHEPPAPVVAPPRDDLGRWLKRRLPLCVGIVAAVSVATAILVYLSPYTYSSTGMVLIERGKSPTMRSDPLLFRLDLGEVLSSEIGILESRTVAEDVVERLGLVDRPRRDTWGRRTKARLEDTLDRLGLSVKVGRREKEIRGIRKRLKIEQPAGTPLLSIGFRADDPHYATEVAGAIMDTYIERHRDIFTDNAAAFFKARLNETEAELRTVRETIGRETTKSRIDELELELAALETTYLFYRDRWDRASAEEAGDKSLVNVRLIDYPTVPQKPTHSRLFRIVQGFLAGLVLAFGVALLRDHFDRNDDGPRGASPRLAAALETVRRPRGLPENGEADSPGAS